GGHNHAHNTQYDPRDRRPEHDDGGDHHRVFLHAPGHDDAEEASPHQARAQHRARSPSRVSWRARSRLQLTSRNLCAARERAFAASSSRLRGGALVSSECSSLRDTAATSSTAERNGASLALEGLLKPLSLRTNCKDAARISSSV